MRNSTRHGLLLLVLCGVLYGCGKKPEEPSSGSAANQQPEAHMTESELKVSKWVKDVSYDSFFPSPLEIAAKTDRIERVIPEGHEMAEAPTGQANPDQASSLPAPHEEQSSLDWANIISAEDLVEESKLIRTRLTSNLQTVGNYNRNYKDVALDGAMLAALASIAPLNSGHISWKAKSHFVRDLASKISSEATATGRQSFNRCKLAFDQLLVVMDGGNPVDTDVEENESFGNTVYTSDLMLRLDRTLSNLKANFNTKARLEENPEQAHRELAILTMIGTMILDESYDSSDQDLYKKYTNEVIAGSKDSILALKEQNLEVFLSGLARIQNTCAPCHQEYRGADSGL